MRRAAAALALTLAFGGVAQAIMPPEVYEEARRTAPNVVVFDVVKVTAPLFRSHGRCQVAGRVIRSDRGTLYKPGDRLTLSVACARPGARVAIGGTLWQDMAALKRSAHGRAHLAADGALVLDQYELYDLR